MASMVVTFELPTPSIGVIQERLSTPSICTVHAPHSAMQQPNFVPVMPSTSRGTHNGGVSPSTSTLCMFPLTLMAKAMVPFQTRLTATSMLPRVALGYGQVSCASVPKFCSDRSPRQVRTLPDGPAFARADQLAATSTTA
jgi:hypothetical protein